jgi:hypothetical protein
MSNTGGLGFVVKASEFTNFLPSNLREKYTQAIADQDTDLVDEILGENAPAEFPEFESSFKLKDEDESENLTKGEIYICFQDEDLYFQTPKPGLNFLKSKGINPEFERWVVWG